MLSKKEETIQDKVSGYIKRYIPYLNSTERVVESDFRLHNQEIAKGLSKILKGSGNLSEEGIVSVRLSHLDSKNPLIPNTNNYTVEVRVDELVGEAIEDVYSGTFRYGIRDGIKSAGSLRLKEESEPIAGTYKEICALKKFLKDVIEDRDTREIFEKKVKKLYKATKKE